jgi:RNA polymerase sigma factor (sigma-70 family)
MMRPDGEPLSRLTTVAIDLHARASGDLLVAVLEEQQARLLCFFAGGRDGRVAAEDLLQETVLRAWGHRRAFESDREGARRYLWRIARNLKIDELRGQRRRRAREDSRSAVDADALALPATSAVEPTIQPAEQVIEKEDCLRVIRETVGGVGNHRIRRCLELWLGGSDLRAIGTHLGLASGQVRGLLQRGRSEIIRRAGERLLEPARGHRLRTRPGG